MMPRLVKRLNSLENGHAEVARWAKPMLGIASCRSKRPEALAKWGPEENMATKPLLSSLALTAARGDHRHRAAAGKIAASWRRPRFADMESDDVADIL